MCIFETAAKRNCRFMAVFYIYATKLIFSNVQFLQNNELLCE